MIKKRVSSYTKPMLVDQSSSPTTVYVNKNVKATPNPIVEGKVLDATLYEYDQFSYNREEFTLIEQYMDTEAKLENLLSRLAKLEAKINELEGGAK